MYSTNLEKISLDEFQTIMTTIDLLPSRKILLNGLSSLVTNLKQKGISTLAATQQMLKNKKEYSQLSDELGVSTDYLTILNREINSYVSKPIPLSKLDIFSDTELAQLKEKGLRSTKDLYEHGLTSSERKALSELLSIPLERIVAALELSDLLRINGVGPVYAKILKEMGINNSALFLEVDSQDSVEAYKRINEEKNYSKVDLGVKDIEYVKRFCEKLDSDIQW